MSTSTEQHSIRVIARIHSDFPTKFGIPRQSGLVEELRAQIVFEPEFRNPDAVRGLADFSHIWLIWQFSGAVRDTWSPTVRPPRLGGNTRMGVFATRSPFRPNPIGLSSVRLERVELDTPRGPILHVLGADLMDGTPIYDIKPYLPYADCHPDASGGFAAATERYRLQVEFPPEWKERVPAEHYEALCGVLANDPRPSYQKDAARIYGLEFAGMEVRFRVEDRTLFVCSVSPATHE
jgi:tRNA-Thr(GGU) m(6)t(6)A37 methyltransferase TsaA